MNPYGLVAAASITSQMSICMRSQSIASSLTSAMFTARNVFSRSFVSSATRADETGWTWPSVTTWSAAVASAVLSASIPPTTLGVFSIVYVLFPGSIRSGEKAR